jgi:hypothetical protein
MSRKDPNMKTPRLSAGRIAASVAAVGIVGAAGFAVTNAQGGSSESDSGAPAGSLPRIPIGGSSGVNGTKISAEAASSSDMSARIGYWSPPEFTLNGDVTLPATAPVWKWSGSKPVTADVIDNIADALGIDGQARSADGMWTVGDPAVKSLNASVLGDQSWWYSDQTATTAMSRCATIMTVPPTAVPETMPADEASSNDVPADTMVPDIAPVEPCMPQTPTNLPSDADASATAKRILDEIGVPYGEIKVNRSDWSVDVNTQMVLNGGRIDASGFNFSFGQDGTLQYANGPATTPEFVGNYPLLSGTAAYERLIAQNSGENPMARGLPEPLPAPLDCSDPAATCPAVGEPAMTVPAPAVDPVDLPMPATAGVEAPADCSDPAVSCAAVDPALVDPVPGGQVIEPGFVPCDDPAAPCEPIACGPEVDCAPISPIAEPMQVTITGVELVWTTFWSDSDVWVVPHASFIAADQGTWWVVALADDMVSEQSTPAITEPPATAPVLAAPVAPAVEPVPAAPDGVLSDAPVPTVTVPVPETLPGVTTVVPPAEGSPVPGAVEGAAPSSG